jgi:arylsulfatase A-like enzyme
MTYLLDLCPTVCDMFGIEKPELWDGESFIDAVRGDAFTGRDHLVCEQSIATLQWAVRTDRHLYVRTLFPGIYPIDEPCWLFDMDEDPHATQNLADELPEVVSECDHLLTDWRHTQIRRHGPHPDPMDVLAEQMASRNYGNWLEYLEERGRPDQAEDAARRLARYRPGFAGG